MKSVTAYIEKVLKLKVNKESAIDRPWKRKFLGFSFTVHREPKVRIAKESVKRLKMKIRNINSRSKPYPMELRIEMLNRYLTGWCGYFTFADTPSKFKEFDEWKKLKEPKTRIMKLIGLGVPEFKAYEWENSRKKYTGESPVAQSYTKPSITLTESTRVEKFL
ncbi:MAG: ltrA [Neobacillus sp.]|nr:ltrA [Neobacillus sp.]